MLSNERQVDTSTGATPTCTLVGCCEEPPAELEEYEQLLGKMDG